MTSQHIQAELQDSEKRETARVGYQVAVNLWTYQGNLNWNRFGVMLTANSIIVAAIGVVLSLNSPLPILRVALPIVGLILCLFWVFLMARGEEYRRYWSSRARELEQAFLSDVITTLVDANKARQGVRLGWLAKLGGSQQVAIYGVMLLFVGVYIIVLIEMLT